MKELSYIVMNIHTYINNEIIYVYPCVRTKNQETKEKDNIKTQRYIVYYIHKITFFLYEHYVYVFAYLNIFNKIFVLFSNYTFNINSFKFCSF